MNRTGHAVTLAKVPDKWLAAFYLGWCDALAGRSWPRAHDTMTLRQQIAYEQGRLWIVAMRSARVRVPRWDGARSGCRPVGNAMKLATQRVGTPVHIHDGRKPRAKLEPPPPRLY